MQAVELPPLPSNARYTYHANECYDWGTFGWGIKTQGLDLTKYKYFIFMNSSVRGPFFPAYLKVRRPQFAPYCEFVISAALFSAGKRCSCALLATVQGRAATAPVHRGVRPSLLWILVEVRCAATIRLMQCRAWYTGAMCSSASSQTQSSSWVPPSIAKAPQVRYQPSCTHLLQCYTAIPDLYAHSYACPVRAL
jgi:hypothetical protein